MAAGSNKDGIACCDDVMTGDDHASYAQTTHGVIGIYCIKWEKESHCHKRCIAFDDSTWWLEATTMILLAVTM